MLSSVDIAAKAALLLHDETSVRWSIPEMCKWINAATNELVILKPSSLTANVAMLLRVGTKQNLVGATFKNTVTGGSVSVQPTQLLDVVRNMGTLGIEADAGVAVTGLARDILDTTLPGWHLATGAEVRHYVFDPKDPKRFYVYPGADGTKYLEVVVARSPQNTLLNTSETYGQNDIDPEIDDIYEGALVDYVLYRAYMKDTEFTGNANRATWHYNAFREALGGKVHSEFSLRPQQKFDRPSMQTTAGSEA